MASTSSLLLLLGLDVVVIVVVDDAIDVAGRGAIRIATVLGRKTNKSLNTSSVIASKSSAKGLTFIMRFDVNII